MVNSNKSRQNPIECEICDKEFKSNNGLKNHFNIVHKLMKKYQCNICQSIFKLQCHLNYHMKIAHQNKKYHKVTHVQRHFVQHIA